jgi:hypothetical protein
MDDAMVGLLVVGVVLVASAFVIWAVALT